MNNQLSRDQVNNFISIAAAKGETNFFRGAVLSGYDINEVSDFQEVPLSLAVLNQHEETVAELLSCGAEPNYKSSTGGLTCLHVAVDSGNLNIVEMLVNSGANVNTQDKWGATPLHMAAAYGHTAIAKYLLANGAAASIVTLRGETPEETAERCGFPEIAEMIRNNDNRRMK